MNNQRRITEQPDNYFIYRYTLLDVRGKLRFILPSDSEAQERLIATLENDTSTLAWTEQTFEKLCAKLRPFTRERQFYLDNHHPSAVRVVKSSIENITLNRTTGVFDFRQGSFASSRIRIPSLFIHEELQPNQTLVVDIASVNNFEQQWVFGDVLKAIEELMEAGTRKNRPKKVVIFVDELNKYAPSGNASSPLINDITDITARGGSLGIILFGAEQFASRIHPQVYGNCANKAFGLTDATETTTDPYRAFPKEIKDRLSELQRGELITYFDFFGQPLRIKFPPPACRKQEDVG